MRVKFLLWIFLAILFLSGCSAKRMPYTAPLLPHDLSSEDVAGKTICSLNNLPVALIHEPLFQTVLREFIDAHEQVHAEDMYNFKGGCWPFIYKYNSDIKFALDAEYRAYCVEGQLALKRNMNPADIWNRIQKALSSKDSELSKRYKNCIY